MLNFEHCRVFHEVVRAGNITRAAEQLHVSQPAVSQTVKLLEEALGCTLLVRSAQGVRPTPEGEVLAAHLARGYAHFAEADRKVQELLRLASGELRIGASDMALRFFLLPHLERFNREHPQVRIHVTNRPSPETLRMLRDGAIDFGLVGEPVPADVEDIRFIPVMPMQDAFFAGDRFAGLRHRTVPWEELAGLPLIALETGTSSRMHADAFLAGQGVRLQPEFELAAGDLIVQFAERGLGVACIADTYAAEAEAAGRLFRLRLETDLPPRMLCLAVPDGLPLSPACRALLDRIGAMQTAT